MIFNPKINKITHSDQKYLPEFAYNGNKSVTLQPLSRGSLAGEE